MNLLPAEPIPTPFPDCYWVLPGRLLAGEYPGARRPGVPSPYITALLEAGITRFIDLTRPGEMYDYDDRLRDESYVFDRKVLHLRSSIGDFGLPSYNQMKMILDQIDNDLAGGEKIYVHCQAGIGRTGTVVGCWLARHGATGRAALKRLKDLRSNMPYPFPSPETDAQRQFVLDWTAGE